MKDAIHVSKENHLKAILEAEAEGRQVIPATLSHWLEVSRPAVTMKRLRSRWLKVLAWTTAAMIAVLNGWFLVLMTQGRV